MQFWDKKIIVKNAGWSNDPIEPATITGLVCTELTCLNWDGANYRGLYSSGSDEQIDIEFNNDITINGLKFSAYAWHTPIEITV